MGKLIASLFSLGKGKLFSNSIADTYENYSCVSITPPSEAPILNHNGIGTGFCTKKGFGFVPRLDNSSMTRKNILVTYPDFEFIVSDMPAFDKARNIHSAKTLSDYMTVMAGGNGSANLIRSVDGGETFQVFSDLPSAVNTVNGSPTGVVIGDPTGTGSVHKSTNGGVNFSNIAVSGKGTGYDSIGDGTHFALASYSSSNGICVSSDSASTWSLKAIASSRGQIAGEYPKAVHVTIGANQVTVTSDWFATFSSVGLPGSATLPNLAGRGNTYVLLPNTKADLNYFYYSLNSGHNWLTGYLPFASKWCQISGDGKRFMCRTSEQISVAGFAFIEFF